MMLRVVLAKNAEYDDKVLVFECGDAVIDDHSRVLTIVDENDIVIGCVPLDNVLLFEEVKHGRGWMTGSLVRFYNF